ncbi:MAG TPA: glycosyltransferase family 39 protein [Bauldia sp.]|nr:glycosyltransferase family 39 protein [Bauldia sp.]
MSARRAVLWIILAGTLVRLALAATTGLGTDESYMAGNARLLALGYFDHPPLHVWMAWAAERLLGESPLAVRLPFVLLFAGTTWLMFALTRRLFGERAGLWAVIALTLAPVFTLADGSWVVPDGPAMFFLLAAAIAVVLATAEERKGLLGWWLAAGLFAGLALLSKFNAAFFPLAVFAWLLTTPSLRRHLSTPGPWLAAAVAVIVLSPALIWNAEHGWVGIAFQAGRADGRQIQVSRALIDLGGQLAYLTPWLGVPFAISLVAQLARGPRDRYGWLLALAAIGPIAVFTIVALWSGGLPHWAMPGWLFAIPLFGRDAAALAERRLQFARGYMAAVALVFAALLAAFLLQTWRGMFVPPSLIVAHPGIDPTVDLVDWRALGPALAKQGLPQAGMAVGAPHWTVAGKVSYALGPGVPVLCVCSDPREFAFRTDQGAWRGHDVVMVGLADTDWASAGRYFDALDPLPDVAITRAGETIVPLQLRLGRNLHFPAK